MTKQNGTFKRTRSPQTNSKDPQVSPAVALQVLSEIKSRLTLANKFGMSHGGKRDIYATLGYPQKVESKDLIAQWKRQDLARAIVDRPTKATWQGDVYISEPNEEDESELEKAYKKLDERLGLKNKLMRVDRLAQLGEYAILLLGFDDSGTDTWGQPVAASDGERELKYVKVVSREHAEVDTWEKDASNERYGLPRIYDIQLKNPGEADTATTTSLKVHYTRIIHVAEELLEDEVEGEPIMTTAYNRLKDLEKLMGGDAEMFWRGARPGYTGSAKEDYTVGSDTETKLMEQLEEYENDLRRFIIAEGIDVDSLAQQIADPKGHVDVQLMGLSALTGIPLRILVGSERGELASSEDTGHWKEWLQARREEVAEVKVLKPFVDRMLEYEILPEPTDPEAGYSVIWPDLFTLSEKDRAEVGSKQATALSNYAKQPASEEMVPLEPFLRYFVGFDQDTVEQIMEMREAYLDELIAEEDELEDDIEEMEVIEQPPQEQPQNQPQQNMTRTK